VKVLRVAAESTNHGPRHTSSTACAKRYAVIPDSSRNDVYDELCVLASLCGDQRSAAVRDAVQLREFFEEEDPLRPGRSLVYVVTEYLAGGDLLSAVSERGSLPEEEARGVFRSLLQCCVDIQSRGIIHRDIKLENVMLTAPHDFHNGVKLIDFGLATDTTVSGPATRICGTPLNVAPEVIEIAVSGRQGEAKTSGSAKASYGHECDIWSAGVSLFFMLSGEPPFHAANLPSLFNAILSGSYSFRDPAWFMVSDSAKDLVARCLSVDPSARITASQALRHPWLHE